VVKVHALTPAQNKQVAGNQEGAAHIKQQRTWRQYMNRSVSRVLLSTACAHPCWLQARRIQSVRSHRRVRAG
jgi:hypothetical protein